MTTDPQPAWLAHAWTHFGVSEVAGSRSNPDILAFYRDAGHPNVSSDSVAWCAAFVGACLERSRFRSTRSLLARSYLAWGDAIEEPRPGAIAVLTRGSDPNAGHVGFLLALTDDSVILLGGNQSDRVSVEAFARSRLISLRWPSGEAQSPADSPTDLFPIALAHVFKMEGGYTDDPHDPGGPTNLGITLATLAAWRNTAVSPENFAALKADVRSLDRATATQIYRERYWTRSAAGSLPQPLALMHFDASVNHGVGGAIRMLQQTVGATIDGEVGPETLAAAHGMPPVQAITAYADLRTARYRSLPHFWRFGRGWLRRVAMTRAAALALVPPSTRKDLPMTTETAPPLPNPKWWGNSMTIWGTIITALSTVLPALGPLIGIDVTAEMIRDLGEGVTRFVQAAGGLIGTILAIYGRTRADAPLTRKPVSLML